MIDLATARLSLQATRHNTLENILFPRNRRSFFAGLALIVLAGGWHAIHHAGPAPNPVARPASHADTHSQDGKTLGANGSLFLPHGRASA